MPTRPSTPNTGKAETSWRPPGLEVETELDRAFLFTEGLRRLSTETVVRIKYRQRGRRRWTRFVVVPDERTSIDTILASADQIAQEHLAARVAREQL